MTFERHNLQQVSCVALFIALLNAQQKHSTCSSSSSSSSSWSSSLSVSVTMTITSRSSWSGVSLWLKVTSWSIATDCEAVPSSPSSSAGNSSVCRAKQ